MLSSVERIKEAWKHMQMLHPPRAALLLVGEGLLVTFLVKCLYLRFSCAAAAAGCNLLKDIIQVSIDSKEIHGVYACNALGIL